MTRLNRLSPTHNPSLRAGWAIEVCMTKHQIIEEPCEVKVSSTVLKTNGFREELVEFNQSVAQVSIGISGRSSEKKY